MTTTDRPRVLIAGGGVAGVETLLALSHLVGEQVSVELLAPERAFIHRPSSVAAPFGFGGPAALDLGELVRRFGGGLHRGAVSAVDAEHRIVVAAPSGEAIPYDVLVVAVGAVSRAAVPGALTFAGPRDAPALEDLLDAVARGEFRRLAFTLPAGATWSLPVYELAVMASVELRNRGVSDVEITVVTPESEPLWIFGAAAGTAVRDMLAARGIELETGARPLAARDGRLILDGAEPLEADAVVALPQLSGPHLDGLPADRDGFLPVDAHGRVAGVAGVYAAGDATTFPIKQGGLATQQADAVAEAIAEAVGALREAAPFRPVLRGLLLTGGAPLYLRAELFGPTGATTARTLRGVASGRALWWPPGKVAGRYLAPYLADARPVDLADEPLADRGASRSAPAPDRDDAFELALLLAEEDAKMGDYRQALHALDAAAALTGGVLPAAWAQHRSRWQRELARTR
ncbi:MAG: FAD-dependent oxidoreductase [Solirubrobacteraceae bacterium]